MNRPIHLRHRRSTKALLALTCACIAGTPAFALSRTWIGGNETWIDAGSTAFWTPADEPDADDEAVFNTANGVTLGSDNTVNGLTMSAGIDLFTNNFDLTVDGLVQLVDSSTNLIIGGANSSLTADSVTINNLANLQLDGGTLTIIEESGNGLLDINAGGELLGFGVVSMTDAVAANTTLIVNDGIINAQRNPLLIFGEPPVGTLSINATDADARIDLDGAGETGDVFVRRNQTLDINVQLLDIFNGNITMYQDTKLDISTAWIMGANATLDIDNGFVDVVFPNPDIPAGTSTISGASFAQNGGTITVQDVDGTLQFDAPFTLNAGTFTNNGHVIFNSNSQLTAAGTFVPVAGSKVTVEANRSLTIAQTNINLDGDNSSPIEYIVQQGGSINLTSTDYNSDSATNSYQGIITLNGGDFSASTGDAEFVMDGTLNMNSTGGNISVWSGEPLDLGNDSGVLDADLNVTGTGQSQFANEVDFNSDADVDIASGATLAMLSTVNFNTVNAANNAQFTGTGIMAFSGPVNVNEAVKLDMVGGTVDLDGLDSVGDFVNIDAPMTINAGTMSNFGRTNAGGGVNTLDINNSVGTGILTVNLDSPTGEWTLNGPGVMNLVNDNTEATLLAGSDLNVNGTLNVTGDVRTTARLDLAGVVNINTAAQPFRLAGGNNSTDPNTIAGATISGVGLLGADTGKQLRGFGTIGTATDFDGTASLLADNGMLTVIGAIVDMGTIGTADVDGVLHFTNGWNNSVTTGVQLNGGTVSGGAITNDVVAGISGHGFVTARVINNTQLFASLGDTLIFQTPGNDNDWDGTTNAGEIEAVSANIELRDVGAAFGFTGTVTATNNHTAFANGFALDFNPGSTLVLGSGGKYRSTSSTDIGGTVTVGAGGGTIEVQSNFFLTFENGSNTTLTGNLQLVNNNINIEDGATFSGGGALVVPDGSHMVADNLSDIGVLLQMQGAFRPGNFNGIGRINLFDYQQETTGELYVEIIGTALNAFDRLVASGDVALDGYLNIDIDEVSPGVPFVPVLGQTFNIITGNSVVGMFDYYDVSGMPAGLAFHVEYLANAVQLQVVTKPIFSADFDEDGDVDLTDLAIWKGAFNLNQLGDANGDNITDIDDWTIWRAQLGSMPGPVPAASVPEPGAFGLMIAAMGLGLRRRRAKRAAPTLLTTLICMLAFLSGSTPAMADPVVSVVNNGLSGGNRQWLVRVAPDPAYFIGGQSAMAVEIPLEVEGSTILSVTKNAVDWAYDNPAAHSPFGGGGFGIQTNVGTGKIFIPLGSTNFFNSNAAVTVATLTTSGSGRTVVTFGGHTTSAGLMSRIAQSGSLFEGKKGFATFGSLVGDADINGKVNTLDFNIIAANFGLSNRDWDHGDFNQDNLTNSVDFNLFLGTYGSAVPGPLPGAPVPEPAFVSATGLLMLALRRNPRR